MNDSSLPSDSYGDEFFDMPTFRELEPFENDEPAIYIMLDAISSIHVSIGRRR